MIVRIKFRSPLAKATEHPVKLRRDRSEHRIKADRGKGINAESVCNLAAKRHFGCMAAFVSLQRKATSFTLLPISMTIFSGGRAFDTAERTEEFTPVGTAFCKVHKAAQSANHAAGQSRLEKYERNRHRPPSGHDSGDDARAV